MTSPLTSSRLSDVTWRRLVNALGRRRFENATGDDVVNWAVDALVAGWESPCLNMLAGLAKPPNEFEVDSLVERMLNELGVETPDPHHFARLYATAVARALLAGDTRPYDGMKQLFRLWLATGYPEELQPWCGLEAEYDLAEDQVYGDVAEVESRILEEARRMVSPG